MTIATGALIEIALVQTLFSQQVINAWQYQVTAGATGVSAADIGQAWWNNCKTPYRGIVGNTLGACFQSVRVTELNNPSGIFGSYAIPAAEQTGTRTPTAGDQFMPPFTAVGVQLVVGTRVTRPGQKRFPYLMEADNINGGLQGTMKALVSTLMDTMIADEILGAPALLVTLDPIVVHKQPDGSVTEHQPITGYLVNPNITSQNTRKIGRGS